jgi:hypothetical protein
MEDILSNLRVIKLMILNVEQIVHSLFEARPANFLDGITVISTLRDARLILGRLRLVIKCAKQKAREMDGLLEDLNEIHLAQVASMKEMIDKIKQIGNDERTRARRVLFEQYMKTWSTMCPSCKHRMGLEILGTGRLEDNFRTLANHPLMNDRNAPIMIKILGIAFYPRKTRWTPMLEFAERYIEEVTESPGQYELMLLPVMKMTNLAATIMGDFWDLGDVFSRIERNKRILRARRNNVDYMASALLSKPRRVIKMRALETIINMAATTSPQMESENRLECILDEADTNTLGEGMKWLENESAKEIGRKLKAKENARRMRQIMEFHDMMNKMVKYIWGSRGKSRVILRLGETTRDRIEEHQETSISVVDKHSKWKLIINLLTSSGEMRMMNDQMTNFARPWGEFPEGPTRRKLKRQTEGLEG